MHFNEIINLAARAWHEIKVAADPEFNDCQITHREQLGAAAKGVVDSGQAFSPFEQAVLRLYRADMEAKSEAEQILADNPTLHGDEVMHIASGVPHPLAGHAENAQMAAVREEFRGADASGFESAPLIEEIRDGNRHLKYAPKERLENESEPLKGKLPADFPGHDLLHDAEINTYPQLIRQCDSEEGLEGVPGIGPSMAAKIANRLAEDKEK